MKRLGRVFLIGAGPGDPELITLRGLKRLREADCILYDDLIPKELLRQRKRGAKMIFVGKKPGRHTVDQAMINRLLFREVRIHKRVVRLKGGDPFIFGRGGEEMLYLRRHGINVEVVPGVSSATGIPASLGIPLTHRGLASSFAVITGHSTKASRLIRVPRADTLVYLMCVAHLDRIVRAIKATRKFPATTRCFLISQGTMPGQKAVAGNLKNIVARARKAAIRPPAIFIVGNVIRLGNRGVKNQTYGLG